MRKILWIHNVVYIPILGTNKYMEATVNGLILNSNQYTEEEIRLKSSDVKEAVDFHDYVSQWGNKL